MANEYSADVPKGFNVPKQVRLDSITNVQNEASLKDLGVNNNLAFKYYDNLKIYCKEEKSEYIWREAAGIETGLLDSHFTYPNYPPIDGIDYSGKSYNFFPVINTIVSNEVYIEEGDNIIITGTGVELDPFIINGLESPLNQIDEGNGSGIIIRDRTSTNYGNIGNNAVDFSYNDTVSSTKGSTGENSFSINKSNTSSGENSFSGGLNNISSGLNSFSFGENNESNNINSISLGSNIISNGISAIGIGKGLNSKSFSEIALGSYNSNYTPISTSTWSATDRLFTIGNGFNEFNKSDALLIYKNGLALLPTVTNSLIENATGKAIVTKEYLESILPSTVDGSETKLLEGTNITITGNGTTMTPYIISYTADDISQYTDEMARDAVGTILENTNTITFNYDDVLETINAKVNINASSTSTGILSGGNLSIGTLPTLWSIQEGEGYIYNSLLNTTTHITWETQIDLVATYLNTDISTYVLIDSLGEIIQQTTAPTQQQLRTHIYIGKLAHATLSTILFTVTEPSRMFDISGQIGDLNRAIGPVNVGGGNVINHNGSNLTISATAGGTYRPGSNYSIDRNSPSITSEPQVLAPTFRRKYRNGSGGWIAVNNTTIDPDRYDNNSGTLVTVPTGKFTVQVLWRFGNTGTIHVDYGQTYYDTLEQARASIGGAIIIQDPDNVRDAVKRGWLIVKQNTNVLNNSSDAVFIQADKFGERGATGAIPSLQAAYKNSSSPEIETDSILGAFSIKRGSTSDTDNVFEIINGSGSITSTIKGSGAFTALSYNGFNPTTDLRAINTTSPLLGGGNLTADRTLSIQQSTSVQDGYLSSTDWNVFNNKQPAGAYITSLTGEVTASGAGAAVATLSTSAVTGKILAGLNITGGSISSADSILSAFGKVQNQINGVLGGSIFQTTWNASTNTPTLTSSVGTKGYYYIVDVAGSTNLDGITDWKMGDWAIYDGTVWRKVDNTDAVSSVNGFTGAVSLTTSNITEGTNLYYTEGRVSANTDVAANTAARHNAVTLGTTNGLSLSGQQISLGLSSTSTTGALSSTDWNTFNNKQNTLTNPITGTGATNYVSKWSGTNTQVASSIFDNGTFVGIGTATNAGYRLSVNGTTSVEGVLTINPVDDVSTLALDGGTIEFNTTSGTMNLFAQYLDISANESITMSTSGNINLGGYSIIANAPINIPAETASTIAHFDSSKNIKSLPTATYPSLTELSYAKGVTSSIQTQINNKAPATGGTGYIQNQNSSAQSANMWISGSVKSNLSMNLNRSSLTSSSPFRFMTNDDFNWFLGQSPFGTSTNDLSFYSYGNSQEVFKLNYSTGAATFASKITWGTGTFTLGDSQIYNTATDGTNFIPKAGSVDDFRLYNGGGLGVLKIPAGTRDVMIEGGNLILNSGGYIYGDTTTTFLRLDSANGSYLQYGNNGIRATSVFTSIFSTDIVTLSTAGSERVRVASNGNVLVNTTTDDGINKLQVNGGIKGNLVEASGGFVIKNGANVVDIYAPTLTSDRSINFPDESGTVALLNSPTFTGTPTTPTATAGTNTTQIATTAFVQTANSLKQNTLTNPLTGSGSQLDSNTYALQDGTILYHSVKWFTPTSTVSTSGTTVTSVGTQFTSAMVGAKLIINGEWRIITVFISTTVVTVASAYSQDYSGVVAGDWGVFSKSMEISNTGSTRWYSTIGVNRLFLDSSSYMISERYDNNSQSFRILPTDFSVKNTFVYTFSGTTLNTGTKDLGLRRNAAGVLEIYDGITATGLDANRRDLLVRNLTITGTPTAPTATAGTNTTQIATTAFVQNSMSSGVYTPTFTNTTNVTSSTLNTAYYTRINNIVNVTIAVQVTMTTPTTDTILTFSLPISGAVSANGIGQGNVTSGGGGLNAYGIVDITNSTTAQLRIGSAVLLGSGSGIASIIFTYTI